jgi:RNA polymerase sigma-70 factor, ECF subfamily
MTGVMTATRAARALSLSGRRRQRAAGERLAELFELHGRLVYGVCRLMLRDPVEAEDAAQQAFLSAYQALLAGQEPREPSAWLGTIARNECRTRLRARRTEPLTLVREPAGEELQREVDRHDEIQALCAALAELPHQQRDAIVLREFYGLSYAEVGAALGLSGAAVESVIFRSRKRLQEHLRPARSALGVLTLPLSLRDSLAQLLPGFGAGGASAGAGAAVFAKFASAPVAAKLAAAALAVGAAGTVARIETTHVARQHARPPARVAQVAAVRGREAQPRPARVVAATRPVDLVVRKPAVVTPSRRSGSDDGAETEHPSGGVAEREHSGSGGGTSEPTGQEPADRHGGSGESGSGDSGSGDSGSGGGEHSGSGDSGSGDSGHSGDGDPVEPGD